MRSKKTTKLHPTQNLNTTTTTTTTSTSTSATSGGSTTTSGSSSSSSAGVTTDSSNSIDNNTNRINPYANINDDNDDNIWQKIFNEYFAAPVSTTNTTTIHKDNNIKSNIIYNENINININQNENENENDPIYYGQFVIGPPGSGKTTYCISMCRYLRSEEGEEEFSSSSSSHQLEEKSHSHHHNKNNKKKKKQTRSCYIVNLDPDNDYKRLGCEDLIMADIRDLITLDDVIEQWNLGPNGGLIYCMEYLSQNMSWLKYQLNHFTPTNNKNNNNNNKTKKTINKEEEEEEEIYLIFDCPGQVELYSNHGFMRDIVQCMLNEWNYRLTCVNICDIHHCISDQNNQFQYISLLLLSLTIMLHLEMPHINVLSKMDLLEKFEESMAFPIDYYCDGMDLNRFIERMSGHTTNDYTEIDYGSGSGNDIDNKKKNNNNNNNNVKTRLNTHTKKFQEMNRQIADLIESFGLISFIPLNVFQSASLSSLLTTIDKSNGYDLI